jgi:tRNA threonylcarbamoyladenosine biosynthesis protein TsaE
MFSQKVTSVKELDSAAKKMLSVFSQARIFAFYGKMGAGKTTFIQAICRVLGSSDFVTSPTFAIVNEYSGAGGNPIFHFDFYRIKKLEEAYDLGYEEYFFSGNYCLIEWPELVEPLLPENIVKVKIEAGDDETRVISAENT